MKKLIVLLLLASVTNTYCQDWPIKKLVMGKKALNVPFEKLSPFIFTDDKYVAGKGQYQQLSLAALFNNQIMELRPAAIELSVPLSSNSHISLSLVQCSLGFVKFTENNAGIIDNVRIPVTYMGIISGEKNKNTVTLTVNDSSLSLVAVVGNRIIKLVQAKENNRLQYQLFDNSKIIFPPSPPINCGTKDENLSAFAITLDLTGGLAPTPTVVTDKCVNVFVDCFDSLYFNQSSSRQQTIEFVYELFNAVRTGFYNEQINIQITTINVWTSADPYRGDTRENALSDLANNYQDNFFGNLCVGLDFSTILNGRSGRADAIGKVKAVSTNTCPAYQAGNSPFCYCDMNYPVTVSGFPAGLNTSGTQVYLVMHEIGHLLGSRHTHWCGWKLSSNPDTFGALDSCRITEGGCPLGPPPPANGGTIMSYCVGGSAPNDVVAYNNGFGPQPGTAIRNFVDASPCILNCSDCFGLIRLNKGSDNEYALRTDKKSNNNSNGQPKTESEKKYFITPKKPGQ